MLIKWSSLPKSKSKFWDSCIFKFVPFFFAWVEENKEKEEKGREIEFKKQIAKIVWKGVVETISFNSEGFCKMLLTLFV